MTLRDLIETLAGGESVLLPIALAVPLAIYIWAKLYAKGPERRLFGHVTSSVIALGLVGMVVDVAACMYLHSTGTNLVDVPLLSIVAPFWFGFGSLFAATRAIPFDRLSQYPFLRRVWAILSIVGLCMVVWMILKHTFLVVWTSVIGFVILALIVWSLFSMLAKRVTDDAPQDGDPDLMDEVADDSRRRIGGFFKRIGRSD